MEVTLALLLGLAACASGEESLPDWNCCGKGAQLGARPYGCTPRAGWRQEALDQFVPWYPAALWSPRSLQGLPLRPTNATARFRPLDLTTLSETDDDVELALQWDRWERQRLQVQVQAQGQAQAGDRDQDSMDPALVRRLWYCVDEREGQAEGQEKGTVILAELRAVPKCCSRRQHLHVSLRSCQAAPPAADHPPAEEEEEEEKQMNARQALWLPRRLQRVLAVRVRFGELRRFNWTVAVEGDVEEAWQLGSAAAADAQLQLLVRDALGRARRPFRFCFDADENGRRVLLARVKALNKCCRKGEQMDAQLTACVPREGLRVEQTDGEQLAPDAGADALYWLPRRLRPSVGEQPLPVFYNWVKTFKASYVFREDDPRWSVSYDPEKGEYALQVVHGNNNFSSTALCFEAVSGGPLAPRVALTVITKLTDIVGSKCCLPSQALSPSGQCVTSAHVPWSPLESSAASLFFGNSDLVPYAAFGLPDPLCQGSSLRVLPPETPERLAQLVRGGPERWRFHDVLYCADFQKAEDGGVREVLAACDIPPSAWLYQGVRPLQVVAAVLLACAVATVLQRGSVRRNLHGRALACHAACLMAANALQATFFFTHYRGMDCTYYAYVIYFFQMAAAFWLNVISVNMARGFGLAAPTSVSKRSACIRLTLASLWAWGGAAALTALVVAARHWRNALLDNGNLVPSFTGTRTCFVEAISMQRNGVIVLNENAGLGELAYYFTPVALLVAANAVCLGLTLRRVWDLQQHGEMLKSTTHAQRSALLYVKLLLTASVAEVAVEAIAWGVRPKPTDGRDIQSEVTHNAYVFAVAGTFLDVARALAVLWLCVGGFRRYASAVWRRLRGPPPSPPAPKPCRTATTPVIQNTRL